MPLKNVPLFGVGNQGRSANVSAQKRVNLYVELQSDREANGLVLYPTPGLSTFVNFGANPCRGFHTKGNAAYFVNGGTLWEVAGDGTTTNRGTLLTTGGRVDIADNGDQMLIVDGTYGYIYTFATTTLAQITDPDFVPCETCTFLNGYFVVQKTASGQFYKSALYDGMSWDALDFATAESDPDNLVRVLVDSGMLYLFGDRTTEFWGDSGTADFPLARIGSAAIEWGLAARWSLCKFEGSLMFLRRNKLGSVQVCQLSGNQATPVSTPELDYILSTYAAVDNATAFAYMVAGHPMYQINFPTPGESWEYDGLSKEWHRKQYGQAGRHRGEIQANFLNRPFVTDYENGKVYLIDQDAYTDDGQYIVREFVSRHNKAGEFIRIPQLWIEMEAGVGLTTGQGSDPTLVLQVSRDGGHSWGAQLPAAIGRLGQYTVRALWNRLGRARDWMFKVRCTDPVKTVFVAAWARTE
jgi:hypothetical protein